MGLVWCKNKDMADDKKNKVDDRNIIDGENWYEGKGKGDGWFEIADVDIYLAQQLSSPLELRSRPN